MTLWRNLDMSTHWCRFSARQAQNSASFLPLRRYTFLGTTIKMQLIIWKNPWRIKDSLYLYG